jgi:DNA-binding transcriptional LysR family regulator
MAAIYSIEIIDLVAFIEVAKKLNFADAAKSLQVSPPHVSKLISHLEDKVQKKLFVRTTRQVGLTSAGRELLPAAEAAVAAIRDTENMFIETMDPNLIQGEIRMNCAHTLGIRLIAKIVARFHELYPKVQITTILSDQYEDLIEEKLDMVIRIVELKDSNLVAKKLGSNPVVLCAAPTYLNKNPAIASIADLERHALLYIPQHGPLKFKRSGMTLSSISKSSWAASTNGDFLTELGRQGAGIVVRSRWSIQRELDDGCLVEIDVDDELISTTEIYAMYAPDRYMPRRLRLWIDFLQKSFEDLGI